jgi:hypothetical protein
MTFYRKLLLFVSRFLFRSFLFAGLSLLGMVMVFGDPQQIKSALVETKAYERYVNTAIDNAQAQASTSAAIPLEDPQVQRIVRENFSDGLLRQHSEKFIDSIYSWLNGQTDSPEFLVDVSSNKQKLADDLSNYAVARLGSLPVCTSFPQETDIYKLSCVPPNMNFNQQRLLIRSAILNDSTVIENTKIDINSLPKNQEGQTITDAFKDAPDYFGWFKRAPWLLLGLSILAASGILLLSRDKRTGIASVGKSTVGIGFVFLIVPLVYTLFTYKIRNSVTSGHGGAGVGAITGDVFTLLYNELNRVFVSIAVSTIIIGIVILLALKFTRPNNDAVISSQNGKPLVN